MGRVWLGALFLLPHVFAIKVENKLGHAIMHADKAVEKEEDSKVPKYYIDDRELQGMAEGDSEGLEYRASASADAPVTGEIAKWTSVVLGTDLGNGWLQTIDGKFLPMTLAGKNVVTSAASVMDDLSWVATPYIVDNSVLKAGTGGLSFRSEKMLASKMLIIAPWGTTVYGHDDGDGWFRVMKGDNVEGKHYLPMKVNGVTVLKSVGGTTTVAPEAPVTDAALAKAPISDVAPVLTEVEEKHTEAVADAPAEKDTHATTEEKPKGLLGYFVQGWKQARKEADQKRSAEAKKSAEEKQAARKEVADKKAARKTRAMEEQAAKFEKMQAELDEERQLKEEEREAQAELGKLEKQKEWTKAHYTRSEAGKDCPDGWEPVLDRNDCKNAHRLFGGIDNTDYEHSWGGRPAGCQIYLPDQKLNYNSRKPGRIQNDTERICQKFGKIQAEETANQDQLVKLSEVYRSQRIRDAKEAAKQEKIAMAIAEDKRKKAEAAARTSTTPVFYIPSPPRPIDDGLDYDERKFRRESGNEHAKEQERSIMESMMGIPVIAHPTASDVRHMPGAPSADTQTGAQPALNLHSGGSQPQLGRIAEAAAAPMNPFPANGPIVKPHKNYTLEGLKAMLESKRKTKKATWF